MNPERASNPSLWSQPADELLQNFASSSQGLTSATAAQRLLQNGLNVLETRGKATPLRLMLSQFTSPIILILLFATFISALLGDWVDAVIIFIIIASSALLSFVQEYSANHAAEKLRLQIKSQSTVLRDGQPQSIPNEDLVAGDVVMLSAGSLVPADGILLEAKDFFVNQAVLTGETFPVEKEPGVIPATASLAERTNMVFMGTNVRSGSARVLIVQTGAHTAFGQIAARLSLRAPETEFERGIRRLGYLLTQVMFLLVLGIFAFNVYFHKPPIDSLLFSIALAVGLTPQLLPAIININLSRGAQKMAASGVIVRRLASIENFGSMDTLCTDKTGTVTVGVVQLDAANNAAGQPSDQVFEFAYRNAYFQTGLANPLDEAILSKQKIDLSSVEKVDEVPYDFVRKRLSVVIRAGNQNCLITKGAFENILSVCTSYQTDGTVRPLDDSARTGLHQLYQNWGSQGYRVLGVASREFPDRTVYSTQDERDLTFNGFLLFFDPPKPGVQDTIARLEQLGIRLKIITGDNRLVAEHTAQTIGLPEASILTGADLDKMRDEALWQAAEKTGLFAEVDPNQKERIILALKKTGHVVGYMGDGINDAPALHSADVSISVNNAVDVAKEAADFVLLQQDLDVLRQGIIAGRKTFANTLKYVFMATSANFGNMFSMAGASLFLPFLPMLPKQILLINFFTDLPEMTIAGDNVDSTFIDTPHRWDIRFIRRFMLVFGALSSIFDFLTFGVLLFLMKASETQFHTGWFIESVLSATLVVFAVRTRLPFQRSQPSRAMLVVTAGVGLAALLLPYTPLARVIEFAPLSPIYLAAIVALVSAYFVSAELAKRWFYRHYPS